MNLIKAIKVDESLKHSKNFIVDLQMDDGADGYGRLIDTTTNDQNGVLAAVVGGINAEIRTANAKEETDRQTN